MLSISKYTFKILSIDTSFAPTIKNASINKNEQMRFALGSVYPTDFAAHIFYIVLVAICLYNRKVNIVEPFMIMIIAFWVYKWTIASTSLICMVVFSVFILGYIICKTKKEKIKDNIFSK